MCKITSKQERLINIALIDLSDELNGMDNISTVVDENLQEWGRIELADFMTRNIKDFNYTLIRNRWTIKYSGKEYKNNKDIKKQLFRIIKGAVKDGRISSDVMRQINPIYYKWLDMN